MSTVEEIQGDLLEVPVIFKTKSGDKKYTVREMPGDVLDGFLKENQELVEVLTDERGQINVKMENFEQLTNSVPSLLQRCLYDDEDNLIPFNVIKKMPQRVQRRLFEIAQEVNAMTKQSADEAGNLQTGIVSGIDSHPGSTALLPNANEKQEPDDS